MVQFKQYM